VIFGPPKHHPVPVVMATPTPIRAPSLTANASISIQRGLR